MVSIEITFSITNVNYVTFPFAINFSARHYWSKRVITNSLFRVVNLNPRHGKSFNGL